MAEDEIARKTDELLERIGLSAERDTLVKSAAGLETETCFLRFHLSRAEDRLSG